MISPILLGDQRGIKALSYREVYQQKQRIQYAHFAVPPHAPVMLVEDDRRKSQENWDCNTHRQKTEIRKEEEDKTVDITKIKPKRKKVLNLNSQGER